MYPSFVLMSIMKLILDEPLLTKLRKNSFEYSNLLKIVDAFISINFVDLEIQVCTDVVKDLL